jgi:di/tricarboxylate transporter
MTLEIAVVFAVFALAVVLFATERIPIDLAAILVMSILMVTGIITPEEGIGGFSNTATVTVGAMFVLSAGLLRTGAVNSIGARLAAIAKKRFWLSLLILMGFVAVISAFVNNTPVVAVFIPICLGMARESGTSVSKTLMPLSFAAVLGGLCTLIGTSANLLVSSIAEQYGQKPFGMFEFTPLGLIYCVTGIAYLFFVGVRMIPDRRGSADLTKAFAMKDYLVEVVLHPEANSVGKTLRYAPIVQDLDIAILNLRRNGQSLGLPDPDTVLLAGDELLVRCNIDKIKKLEDREGVSLKPRLTLQDADLKPEGLRLAEAIIAPNSMLVGRSIKESQFRSMFGAIVLALRHRGGEVLREKLSTARLKAGDALLIEVRGGSYERLKRNREFVIVSDVDLPQYRKSKVLPAIAIVLGVVSAAAMGVLPIVVSAIIGAVLLVLTGCISLQEAYDAVDWKIIFLIAGVLTLGTAMQKSGAAELTASILLNAIGGFGPVAVLSAFYLMGSMLTEVMSNNATAALLAPIAVATAASLGVDSRPLLFALAFSASASFMTPVGYQTNTMIYAAGQYRFSDFLKVGTPMNIIYWILGTLLIPKFWPF